MAQIDGQASMKRKWNEKVVKNKEVLNLSAFLLALHLKNINQLSLMNGVIR